MDPDTLASDERSIWQHIHAVCYINPVSGQYGINGVERGRRLYLLRSSVYPDVINRMPTEAFAYVQDIHFSGMAVFQPSGRSLEQK